jgi:hypothetical protein
VRPIQGNNGRNHRGHREKGRVFFREGGIGRGYSLKSGVAFSVETYILCA